MIIGQVHAVVALDESVDRDVVEAMLSSGALKPSTTSTSVDSRRTMTVPETC